MIGLVGVLLMIIAIPQKKDKAEETEAVGVYEETDVYNDAYTNTLETKLEEVLGNMSGVGKVEVMITLKDEGELFVDKNITAKENEKTEETVLYEENDNTHPFVTSKLKPEIDGVLVVAEGGDEIQIISDISEAIMALFDIKPHKIKVVKMSD